MKFVARTWTLGQSALAGGRWAEAKLSTPSDGFLCRVAFGTGDADLEAEDGWIFQGVKSAVRLAIESRIQGHGEHRLGISPWGSHCSSLCVHFLHLASRRPSQTALASMATGCRLAGHCSSGGSGIMTCTRLGR